MRKHMLMLTALLLALVVLPTAAMAVNNETDLRDALAKGGLIQLTGSIDLENGLEIPAGVIVTIDLNGKTLSYNTDAATTASTIKVNGELTIKDSATGGKVTFYTSNPDTAQSPGYASNVITNYGKFTLESGIIENLCTGGGACYALDCYAGSTANINGGKLIAKRTTARVFNWTNGVDNKATLNVNGGEILSDTGYAINMNTGNTPYVELNISGGTVTSENNSSGLAVYIVAKGNAENAVVKVEDGTINGAFGLNGVFSKTMKTENVSVTGGTMDSVICWGEPESGFVSGGTFAENPSAYVVPSASAAQVTSGSETVYTIGAKSTQEAAEAAAANGESVTVTVTKGNMTIPNLPVGVVVVNQGDGKVTANGASIAKGESYTIPHPVVSVLPQTGDNSSLVLFAALLALSGAGLMLLQKRGLSR